MQSESLTGQVLDYLAHAPTSELNGQDIRLLHHWQGDDNLLWQVEADGQTAVFKLFMDAGQARGRRQYDGQSVYAPLEVAPRPLWFDRYPQGLSRQALVYTWVEGKAPEPAGHNDLAALAQSIARVHMGDSEQVRRFCPHPVNLDFFWQLTRHGLASTAGWLHTIHAPALAEWLQVTHHQAELLVEQSLPLWQAAAPTPVHGDLRLANAVITPTATAVLLDWEQYGLGDPAQDIARFLFASQASIPEEMLAYFLQSYLTHTPIDGLDERIQVYQTLLPVQALDFLLGGLRQAWETPAGRKEITANLDFLAVTLAATLQGAYARLQAAVPAQQQATPAQTITDAVQAFQARMANPDLQ